MSFAAQKKAAGSKQSKEFKKDVFESRSELKQQNKVHILDSGCTFTDSGGYLGGEFLHFPI